MKNLKLSVIGPNQTQMEIGDATVLFSYNTPVAAHLPALGWVRTAQKFSVTTSRHVNRWLDGMTAKSLPAEQFAEALSAVGVSR
jgi:hypothetical protein